MIKKEGEAAQAQAREWGLNLHRERVVKTLHGEHVPCRWVYVTRGAGCCLHCQNWDYSGVIKERLEYEP